MVARWALSIVLLLLPFVAVLWTPLFNRVTPEVAGIPFFYWYQLAWIPLGSVLLFALGRLWRVPPKP